MKPSDECTVAELLSQVIVDRLQREPITRPQAEDIASELLEQSMERVIDELINEAIDLADEAIDVRVSGSRHWSDYPLSAEERNSFMA